MIALNFVGNIDDLTALLDRLIRIYGQEVTVLQVINAVYSQKDDFGPF